MRYDFHMKRRQELIQQIKKRREALKPNTDPGVLFEML